VESFFTSPFTINAGYLIFGPVRQGSNPEFPTNGGIESNGNSPSSGGIFSPVYRIASGVQLVAAFLRTEAKTVCQILDSLSNI
jgi:hypothetical protein